MQGRFGTGLPTTTVFCCETRHGQYPESSCMMLDRVEGNLVDRAAGEPITRAFQQHEDLLLTLTAPPVSTTAN
jgi:hypothetical protein